MKVAVVVPFCTEPIEWLEACFESVLNQTSPAALIAISDGQRGWRPRAALSLCNKLIELPEAHGDGGRAARAIGAVEAIVSGFDAVAFLDADNWFAPNHVEEMIRLHESTGAPLCTSSLAMARIDGTPWDLPSESDGEKHADTSTIFVTREAFPLLINWALVPFELAPINDRVWWQLAKSSGYQRAHSPLATAFYRNRYAAQYRLLGETPPEGTKEFLRPPRGNYSLKIPAMEFNCQMGRSWKWLEKKG